MSRIQKKLDLLFQTLEKFLTEKKLISRLELRFKIRELISSLNFSPDELLECENLYEYPLHQMIFLSVTSGGIFPTHSPLLTKKIEFKEMNFYYSPSINLTEDLLNHAYKEMCKLQFQLLTKILINFLQKGKYTVQIVDTNLIIADRDQYSLKCLLFCSILHLTAEIEPIQLDPHIVLIVPPGTSIEPFIKFYQNYSNKILLAEASVWLVDTELETVSRFIGLPSDKNLLANFTRSQLSTLIERYWRPTISEDF